MRTTFLPDNPIIVLKRTKPHCATNTLVAVIRHLLAMMRN